MLNQTRIQHFYQQQQLAEDRAMRRLQQFNSNQAAILDSYNSRSNLVRFADGGSKNARTLNNSSWQQGGILPVVSNNPNGSFIMGR